MEIFLHKPNKEKFVRGYLEKLIEKEADIRDIFDKAESETERNFLKAKLKESLENSYDTYAKEYFSSKGIGSYVSTFLRAGGAIADATGTYNIIILGATTGLVGVGIGYSYKAIGLAIKSLADLIDGYKYARYVETDTKTEKALDVAKLAGETIVTRLVAYAPLGVGDVTDFLRGRSKYDNKITARTLTHAKEYFLKYLNGELDKIKIAKLDNFRNKDYISKLEEVANQPVKEEVGAEA